MSWRDDLSEHDKARLEKALNLYQAIREGWTAPESDDVAILTIAVLFAAIAIRTELRAIVGRL